MKALLVGESPRLKDRLEGLLETRGWDFIQYYSPIKAMDNLDEIDPAVILFSALDYPRHWKPLLVFLRGNRDKRQTVFILLRGPRFPQEEVAEASFLGANGIADAESIEKDVDRIVAIVERHRGGPSPRKCESSSVPGAHAGLRVNVIFAHPETGRVITGTVKGISPEYILFEPDRESRRSDFRAGMAIAAASLRLGDVIHTVDLRIGTSADVLRLDIRSDEQACGCRLTEYFDTVYGKGERTP